MRTERWLSDETMELDWPADWSVSVLWPHLPPPLSGEQITAALRHPVGLATLDELRRGKRKPLVIIDDLLRPTPGGGHGLFPLVDQRTLLERIRRKVSVMSLSQLAAAITDGVRHRLAKKAPPFAWPVLLYRPGTGPKPDLPPVEGMEVASSWQAAIATIRAQHPGVKELRVVVYPCAPLQVLDSPQPPRSS